MFYGKLNKVDELEKKISDQAKIIDYLKTKEEKKRTFMREYMREQRKNGKYLKLKNCVKKVKRLIIRVNIKSLLNYFRKLYLN